MDKSNKNEHARKKKKLLVSKRKVRNIVGLSLLGVLVIGFAVYFLIDSRSYAATVAGNRIMAYEYKFLLHWQISTVEMNEGLTNKTQAEKDQYWTKTENGQNPLETAKNDALTLAKEYEIQLAKAYQMGLKVDANVKGYADQYLKSYQSSIGLDDNTFITHVKGTTGVTLNELRTITERQYLISQFRTQYIKNNYKPAQLTDEDVKAEYDKDPKKYDTVEFSYVVISKKDSSGALLSQSALDNKKAKADEALKKMQAGQDITAFFSQYTETTLYPYDQNGTGKAKLGYATGAGADVQPLLDYLFNHLVGTSGIVETDNLLYVVKIDKYNGYDALKDTIKSTMESTKESDWYTNQVHQWDLDPQYNIVKNDPVYDSISYK